MSVVILTVILYCPINHWSRHYEPGLCLFNLELHSSSPAPDQLMLQFYCLLLQFLQFSRHELCYQLHLLIGLAGEHYVYTATAVFPIIPAMKFSCKYLHWAMCRRWTGSILCCVCRLMFVGYFVSWRRTITDN